MVPAKAVVLDFIGTLANVRRYTLEASMVKLHGALGDVGFVTGREEFLRAYRLAHEKYRLVRYGEFREVTNAVWVSEALCSLGFEVGVGDERLGAALEVFFGDFVDSLELRIGAEGLLRRVRERCKVGLVSNFTYAPAVHAGLARLGIEEYFDVVVVSHENGWRKPHRRIFEDALARLGVDAGDAVYVGDSPLEDIRGAAGVGMRTVFVESQFYGAGDLRVSGEKCDFEAEDLDGVCGCVDKFLG